MRVVYTYPDRAANMETLRRSIAALGLPDFEDVSREGMVGGGFQLVVRCGTLTAGQQLVLQGAISGHDASVLTAEQVALKVLAQQQATDMAYIRGVLGKNDKDITADEVKQMVLRTLRRQLGVTGP